MIQRANSLDRIDKHPTKIMSRYGRAKIKIPPELVLRYQITAPSTASFISAQQGVWYLDPVPPETVGMHVRHKYRLPIIIWPVDIRKLGHSIYAIHQRSLRGYPRWQKGTIVCWTPIDDAAIRLDWLKEKGPEDE